MEHISGGLAWVVNMGPEEKEKKEEYDPDEDPFRDSDIEEWART